ncbi:hypothetical protein [Halovivax gelatinilyticus]|nr:hypothetical protein [Halovivax gelatinilyticus]
MTEEKPYLDVQKSDAIEIDDDGPRVAMESLQKDGGDDEVTAEKSEN